MKVRSLQFGKAISAALFVLLLSVAGMKNALAQTLVATLKHGDDISFFYGADALVNAHNAAETGDIITLSSGSFAPTTITKAITLRGAGCMEDTISGVHPTVLPGDMHFNVEDTENYLTVEGIFFSGAVYRFWLHHPKFVKCNFNYFSRWDNSMDNAQFINCVLNYVNFSYSSNTTLINCVVWSNDYWSNSSNTVTAFNCIFRLNESPSALTAYNCIFFRSGYGYQLSQYSDAHNCIGIRNTYASTSLFNCNNYNCMEVNNFSDIFETFAGDFSYEEAYILKEEIATGFLGDDGTEVGIHGGNIPYDSRPSYQIVRHYSVPKKSDNEGHLNVEIEVYTEEGE
ncbi:MAG: hypothetical protein IKH61_06900 [Bacteroidales bacterium]|nr:hypothetical protein [Bacteroidales bacterium]